MSQEACIVCRTPAPVEFFTLDGVPVHCNLQWESKEAACTAPSTDLRLVFCSECSHIYNRAFDPARVEYSQKYENSLFFSPFFEAYAHELARTLAARHRLAGKQILEIGCGKGEFLSFLCRLAGSRGVGFDPSYVAGSTQSTDSVRFVPELYSPGRLDSIPDMVICRQVLEHLPEPLHLLQDIRRVVSKTDPRPVIFFEVPNVLFTLRDRGIWDLIYEHVSYFNPASLRRVFEKSGFEVSSVEEVYGGQFLQIETKPGALSATPCKTDSRYLAGLVNSFAATFKEQAESWRHRLQILRDQGKRTVVWGAGSKGVTFLNTFRDLSPADYAVDLNPRKQGRFLPGCGVEIVAPGFLRDFKPHLILIANPLYQDEIRRMVAEFGITPDLEVI